MTTTFYCESEIYNLLQEAGISTPKYQTINSKEDLDQLDFREGQPVVVKGLAKELWHKSDFNGVHFLKFNREEIFKLHQSMREEISRSHEWIETLIVERKSFKTLSELPTSAFVSIQKDQCCGPVINFGVGGIHTEEYAKKFQNPILVWPTSVYTPEEALEELEQSWPGQIWLGMIRQGEELTSKTEVLKFIKNLWKLSELMKDKKINLLEVNPFVVSEDGSIIALDGVGQSQQTHESDIDSVYFNSSSLLKPKKIAIAGVSSKEGTVGRIILENILTSKLDHNNIKVIKPNTKEVLGIECFEDCTPLKENPVDLLILSMAAKSTLEIIRSLLELGGGAEVIYIVAGGLGDGADSNGYGAELSKLINNFRKQNKWTPVLVGPNGLGMIQSDLKLNTLFIPQDKLQIPYKENSHVALVSQSGAFLITRLSRQNGLALKYGYSIGNQLDLKLSHFMKVIQEDESIKLLGLYIEGFDSGDACAISKQIKEYNKKNKQVVIYKGGRSIEGAKAAAGHTGAMTGDYVLQKRLLQKSGGIVVETFNQFNSVFKWMSSYPNIKRYNKVAIVTNAGYETVGSVDILSNWTEGRLSHFNSEQEQALNSVLEKHHLNDLVHPSNPLDITPMANEEAYVDCAEYLANQNVDVVLIGLVPLTKNLETSKCSRSSNFAKRLKEIALRNDKPLGIIIDAGLPYLEYKNLFEEVGLPVFESMDQAVLGINVLGATT